MVVIGGPPGSGKTRLARRLGAALGWPVLSTDQLRRTIAAGSDRYSPAAIDAVYDELTRRAGAVVGLDGSLILDGSFTHRRHREQVHRLAATDANTRVVEVLCATSAAVIAARIGARRAEGTDASEATVEVSRQLAAGRDPWPTAISVDTTQDPPIPVILSDLGIG